MYVYMYNIVHLVRTYIAVAFIYRVFVNVVNLCALVGRGRKTQVEPFRQLETRRESERDERAPINPARYKNVRHDP